MHCISTQYHSNFYISFSKSMVQHDAVEGAYGNDGGTIHPYLKDAWIAIVIGVVLFNIPTENPLEGTWLWKAPPGY